MRTPAQGTFEPHELKTLGLVFDEVWESVATDLGSAATEQVRTELSEIVMRLAEDRQLDGLQIAQTAARLIRERHGAQQKA